MAFVSLGFLLFIAAVILAYFLVPKKMQWGVLLISSYVFFWINSEWLVAALFATTLVAFLTAKWIDHIKESLKKEAEQGGKELSSAEKKQLKLQIKKKTKRVLLAGVIIVLGVLLFLKYYNFFADGANSLLAALGVQIPHLGLILPLGISFYTLQAVAYMTDVYRGKIAADKNLLQFMLFMSYFPQIVQGPIARYKQLANQLYEQHTFDVDRFVKGAQLIMFGWLKKVVIADRIAIPVDQIFNNSAQYQGLIVFVAALGYGIQVYADFSGGMDIARGVSQIMGIELELNFRQPYLSTSIEDFWRRWHITLGAWMKDYVFYPLSLSKVFAALSRGSRKIFGAFIGKRMPAFLSMFIVYFLVGFWHGANWKYIAYGIWNGLFIVAGILLTEKYESAKKKCGIKADSKGWRTVQIIRTIILVSIGRIFSRADSLPVALAMIGSIGTGWSGLGFFTDGTFANLGLDTGNWIVLLAAIAALMVIDHLHEKGIHFRERLEKKNILLRWAVIYAAIAVILIFGIYGPGYDSASFIYEQF